MAPKDLSPSPSRREIVQEILRLEVPIKEGWDQIEEEIARAHTAGFLDTGREVTGPPTPLESA